MVSVEGRDTDASCRAARVDLVVTPTRFDCSASTDGSLELGLIRYSAAKSNSPSTSPGFGKPRQSVISFAARVRRTRLVSSRPEKSPRNARAVEHLPGNRLASISFG
jgi:hypothetical protein